MITLFTQKSLISQSISWKIVNNEFSRFTALGTGLLCSHQMTNLYWKFKSFERYWIAQFQCLSMVFNVNQCLLHFQYWFAICWFIKKIIFIYRISRIYFFVYKQKEQKDRSLLQFINERKKKHWKIYIYTVICSQFE